MKLKQNLPKNIENKQATHSITFTALVDIKKVNNKNAPGYAEAEIIYKKGTSFKITI